MIPADAEASGFQWVPLHRLHAASVHNFMVPILAFILSHADVIFDT
jgi:hypothetical protein